LTRTLIDRTPQLLVTLAVVFFVGSVLGSFSQMSELMRQGVPGMSYFSYLWSMIVGAVYQPAILVAWAAAVHYLSLIAGRGGRM
jgi:hypothetical protein